MECNVVKSRLWAGEDANLRVVTSSLIGEYIGEFYGLIDTRPDAAAAKAATEGYSPSCNNTTQKEKHTIQNIKQTTKQKQEI